MKACRFDVLHRDGLLISFFPKILGLGKYKQNLNKSVKRKNGPERQDCVVRCAAPAHATRIRARASRQHASCDVLVVVTEDRRQQPKIWKYIYEPRISYGDQVENGVELEKVREILTGLRFYTSDPCWVRRYLIRVDSTF